MARSTAPRLATGSTPGRAMSTALAWVLGAAPKAVDAPENIFERVESCTCVSRPMTISQSMSLQNPARRVPVPVGDFLILVCDAEHPRLGEIAPDDVQSDRQAPVAESAGNG